MYLSTLFPRFVPTPTGEHECKSTQMDTQTFTFEYKFNSTSRKHNQLVELIFGTTREYVSQSQGHR